MASMQIKTWRDVREQVIALNPEIGHTIDDIEGVERFKVLQARYHFGQELVDHGQFYLPFQGKLHQHHDPVLPQQVRDMLAYQWQVMPFGMMMRNTVETFIELPTHIIPFRLYYPGRLFSLLTIFEEAEQSPVLAKSFSTVAGCRSLITLPQIAHSQYQDRVTKRLNLSDKYMPKQFSDQWRFFKAVSDARQAQHDWSCDLIFFGREFIEAIEKTPTLKNKLLMSIWRGTAFARHQYIYDLVWSAFIEENLSLATRNSLSVMETVRYLLRVILNASPAYVPSTQDAAGPIDSLTKVLVDIYRIRYYLPVFMQLQHYDGQQPLYYSLQKPTFMHAIPTNRQSTKQTINDLKQVKQTLDMFKAQVLEDALPISVKNTLLYARLQNVNFDYYHPKADDGIITDVPSLLQQDPRFHEVQHHYRHYNKLALPDTSLFFHGCIKVSPQKTD